MGEEFLVFFSICNLETLYELELWNLKLCIIGGLTISGHLHARPLGSSADLLLPTWWVVCTFPDSVFERQFFVFLFSLSFVVTGGSSSISRTRYPCFFL